MHHARSIPSGCKTADEVIPIQAATLNAPQAPRVLLVEDDPVSRAFLTAAVEAVPAEVDSADNLAAALSLALAHDYALWLFDANLADGSGSELLRKLRARFPQTPALAHTATADSGVHEALLAAGFLGVLVKPLGAVAIQQAVRRVLGLAPDDAIGAVACASAGDRLVWDDEAAALALNGNRTHIATLRGLFIAELPHLRERIDLAVRGGDLDGVRGSLHKLRASCGFVGAARLGEAARALHRHADSPTLLANFDEAAADTLATAAAGNTDQAAPSPD